MTSANRWRIIGIKAIGSGVPGFLGALARLEADAQNYERALALIDEALVMSQEGGDRLYDSNLHRLRGNIL